MNLTLLFLVLAAFIGYFLYDSFRKSRRQLLPSERAGNKFRLSYAQECTLLKQLHEERACHAKKKAITIHFVQSKQPQFLEEKQANNIRSILQQLSQTTRIYLLVRSDMQVTNTLVKVMLEQEIIQKIPFQSYDGAVAILRQINCGVHLQSDVVLNAQLSQYLHNIWAVKSNSTDPKHFNSQLDLLLNLQPLTKATSGDVDLVE